MLVSGRLMKFGNNVMFGRIEAEEKVDEILIILKQGSFVEIARKTRYFTEPFLSSVTDHILKIVHNLPGTLFFWFVEKGRTGD